MPEPSSSTTSAVHYKGVRRNHVLRPSKGSGSTVSIMDDLRSELVHEIVEQLNESRISDRASVTVADTATGYVVLAYANYAKYVEDVIILNTNNAALGDVDTDILIGIADAGDIDMENGPTSPLPDASGLILMEGFGTNAFAAQSALRASEATSDNADALTSSWPTGGRVLEAGQCLYAKVINNEGGAITLNFSAETAATDRLKLLPDDYQREVPLVNRRWNRSNNRSN